MEKIDSKETLIRLINHYQNLVFSVCLKLTGDYFVAEDLTQETFLSAYKHLDQCTTDAEKAWLCRIASNKAVDYRRSAARRIIPTAEEELPKEHLIDYTEPVQKVLNKEIVEELKKRCNELPPPYNRIALQYFLEGKSAKEISEQSNANLHTVQTQIYRAREKLKKSFGKELLRE